MTSADKKRIGEILCENGFLSQFELEEGLEEQKKYKNRLLGQILVGLDYITAEQLIEALLIQAKYKAAVSE